MNEQPNATTTKDDIKAIALLLGLLSFGFALMLILCGNLLHKSITKNEFLQKQLDWYHTNYISKVGATSLWPGAKGQMVSYHLYSFDRGLNWYAVEQTSYELRIKGEADKVYPGLLKHLNDMDALVEYCQKHGPITGKPEEQAFLNSIGITFTNK